MNDTINRQAAIDAIMGEYPDAHYPDWYASKIMALPSAQPERPKGEWIDLDSDTEKYDDIMCSNCKQSFTVDAYRWCDIGFTVDDLKFCPNCGADMRGTKND